MIALRPAVLLLVAVAACGSGDRPAAASGDASGGSLQIPSLDSLITERMASAGIVGLAAAVVVDREVVWMKGYGYADREQGIPFTPQTVMNVGSIAKTVTGAALMQAVERGQLSLDEDINRYLPFAVTNPHRPSARITLRDIATHTSGIADRADVYAGSYHRGGDSPVPLAQFLQDYFTPGGRLYSRENFLDVEPGTYREYSNIGAGLAGHIVERVTGEPLNAYTKRTIFAPLGMTRTGWFLSEIDRSAHSRLYEQRGDSAVAIELYGLTTYPDGGLRTSVADLSRFFLALLAGGAHGGARILEPATAAEMQRLRFDSTNAPVNESWRERNSGIFWTSKYNVSRVGHGGSDPGVATDMLTDLDKRVGLILFTNTTGDRAARGYRAVFDALWMVGEGVRAGRADRR